MSSLGFILPYKREKVKCHVCEESFEHMELLNGHLTTRHSIFNYKALKIRTADLLEDQNTFLPGPNNGYPCKCTLCDYFVINSYDFRRHLNKTHNYNSTYANLMVRGASALVQGQHVCNICNVKFSSKESLTRHCEYLHLSTTTQPQLEKPKKNETTTRKNENEDEDEGEEIDVVNLTPFLSSKATTTAASSPSFASAKQPSLENINDIFDDLKPPDLSGLLTEKFDFETGQLPVLFINELDFLLPEEIQAQAQAQAQTQVEQINETQAELVDDKTKNKRKRGGKNTNNTKTSTSTKTKIGAIKKNTNNGGGRKNIVIKDNEGKGKGSKGKGKDKQGAVKGNAKDKDNGKDKVKAVAVNNLKQGKKATRNINRINANKYGKAVAAAAAAAAAASASKANKSANSSSKFNSPKRQKTLQEALDETPVDPNWKLKLTDEEINDFVKFLIEHKVLDNYK